MPRPRHITWQACASLSDEQPGLSRDELFDVVSRLRAPEQWLRIQGADLRRRPDLPEIVRHALSIGLRVQITAQSPHDAASLAPLAQPGTCEVLVLDPAPPPFVPGCECTAGQPATRFDQRWGLCLTASGDLTPDPAIPIVLGNVRTSDVVDLYQNHPFLRALRDPDAIEGKCGACSYRSRCGGSRARALAVTGNVFASDPACTHGLEPLT